MTQAGRSRVKCLQFGNLFWTLFNNPDHCAKAGFHYVTGCYIIGGPHGNYVLKCCFLKVRKWKNVIFLTKGIIFSNKECNLSTVLNSTPTKIIYYLKCMEGVIMLSQSWITTYTTVYRLDSKTLHTVILEYFKIKE